MQQCNDVEAWAEVDECHGEVVGVGKKGQNWIQKKEEWNKKYDIISADILTYTQGW